MEGELAAFFERHRVIATNRGPHGVRDVEGWVRAHAGPFASRIVIREIPAYPAALSSTLARERVAIGAGELPVPPGVLRYILERGLYRPAST
jgi:nicotinic acid mononucleotide adenylyltransferase